MNKKRTATRLLPLLLIVVFGFFALAACGGGPSDQVLVFGRAADAVGLDPARENDSESYMVTAEISEGLVRFVLGTAEVEPALAESWTISDDGLTYTFKLRQGVLFHDGTPFNADAVVVNYVRQFDENNPYYRYGPYKYWGFLNFTEIVKSVEALDEYTVRFTLSRPNAPFLSAIAMPFAGIMSPAAMEQYQADLTNNPVGTGPFKFVSWVRGDTITLERNEQYWGEKAKLDRIIFKVIPDPTARAQALEKGEVDIIEGPSAQDMPRLAENKNITLYREPGLSVGYMAFNTQKKPFDDVRVRRALSYAINKQEIIDAVYGPLGEVAVSALPPGIWGYTDDITAYEYDPQKAKALLAEAGYPDGFSFVMWPVPVTRPYMPNGAKVAEIIQAQLAAVGVRASIEMLDWAGHLDGVRSGKHEVAFLGWMGAADPDNYLATLLSSHTAEADPSSNIAFWKNAEFTALTDRAAVISDQAERAELYKKAQAIFADQAPWVPIANSIRVMPMRRYVKGYQGTPAGQLNNLHLVYIQK